MRALLWDGRRLAVVEDIGVRPPGPGEVEVEVMAAGLCHSDLKPLDGDIQRPLPLILGHEASGIVTAVGLGVDLEVGTHVVLSVLQTCGRCRACREGHPTRCTVGAPDYASPFERHGEVVNQFVALGAFADRTVVRREQVIPVPDRIPDPVAALLGCAAVTGFGAAWQRARIVPGDAALVIGAGGIGLNVVQAAQLAGATEIVVFDTNPRKRDLAVQLGATRFEVVTPDDDLAGHALRLRPDGFDAVFECVGVPALVEASVAALGRGGRAVIVGLPATGAQMTLPVRSLFYDQQLMGCRMGGADPHRLVPDLAQRYLSGELALDPLITKVVPLDTAADLVEELRAGKLDRGVFDLTEGRADAC